QRLVTAQDAERRKIERDLHDGAQQQFVAVGIKARLAEGLIGKDEDKARGLLPERGDETHGAPEGARLFGHGIYPPGLPDQGLAAAIGARARTLPVPVEVDVRGKDRYPQEVEAAVYFCCLEALQNVVKYAGATRAAVRIGPQEEWLVFEVTDDGLGFDPAPARGAGLQHIRHPLAALGGS